jgi:hypothetical protein
VAKPKAIDMNDDQKGFLAAIALLAILILVLPLAYLIGLFALGEYRRPSVNKMVSLNGRPSATIIAELTEMKIGCKKDSDQPERVQWTCWGDEATISGPCSWRIKVTENASDKTSKLEVLLADGHCKR